MRLGGELNSGSCTVGGFGGSGAEILGSTAIDLIKQYNGFYGIKL